MAISLSPSFSFRVQNSLVSFPLERSEGNYLRRTSFSPAPSRPMSSISIPSRPRVFSIGMPVADPTHDDSGSEFSQSGSDSNSDSDDDVTHRKPNGDIVLSMRELKVSLQREMHTMMIKTCRGTTPGRISGSTLAPRDCDVLHCPVSVDY